MITKTSFIALTALMITGVCQLASGDDNIAEKGINEPRVSSLQIYGRYQTNQEVTDKSVLGEKAKRIVARADGQPWEAAAQTTSTGRIKAGDQIVCLAFLKAFKTENNAPAKVTLRFQVSTDPYTEIKQDTININSEWNQYQVTTVADKDYDRGEVAFVVQLAYANQTIDVGPLFILNMNKTTKGSR